MQRERRALRPSLIAGPRGVGGDAARLGHEDVQKSRAARLFGSEGAGHRVFCWRGSSDARAPLLGFFGFPLRRGVLPEARLFGRSRTVLACGSTSLRTAALALFSGSAPSAPLGWSCAVDNPDALL